MRTCKCMNGSFEARNSAITLWFRRAVDTGANVKVFQDSAIPLSVAFLPFNPSMFITSNSNSMLRLVCSIEGKVLVPAT